MSEHAAGPGAGQPPQPVTLAAVAAAGRSFGYNSHVTADRLVFTWSDHRIVVFLLGDHGRDTDLPATLVFDARLRQDLDFSGARELALAVNEWNQERLGPTLSFRIGDQGELQVHARAALQIRYGLDHTQLAEYLHEVIDTIQLAVSTLSGAFPRLHHPGDPDWHERLEQDRRLSQERIPGALDDAAPLPEVVDSGDPAPARPHPVSLDRVRAALQLIGVSRTRGDDEVIVAWVNEVLFGFFLDNGPSYLVKGHWDPNLDPERDFMRIFLLCNDWNETSINTKAFCHPDDDGLQVRVEFTAPIGAGLNDAQLNHNTEVAINQVLHALDAISSGAVGISAVHWPHPDRD